LGISLGLGVEVVNMEVVTLLPYINGTLMMATCDWSPWMYCV